jgi:hypothetical protein
MVFTFMLRGNIMIPVLFYCKQLCSFMSKYGTLFMILS